LDGARRARGRSTELKGITQTAVVVNRKNSIMLSTNNAFILSQHIPMRN
jgi:hypothetical protein